MFSAVHRAGAVSCALLDAGAVAPPDGAEEAGPVCSAAPGEPEGSGVATDDALFGAVPPPEPESLPQAAAAAPSRVTAAAVAATRISGLRTLGVRTSGVGTIGVRAVCE
jgi:hypothetical protein